MVTKFYGIESWTFPPFVGFNRCNTSQFPSSTGWMGSWYVLRIEWLLDRSDVGFEILTAIITLPIILDQPLVANRSSVCLRATAGGIAHRVRFSWE